MTSIGLFHHFVWNHTNQFKIDKIIQQTNNFVFKIESNAMQSRMLLCKDTFVQGCFCKRILYYYINILTNNTHSSITCNIIHFTWFFCFSFSFVFVFAIHFCFLLQLLDLLLVILFVYFSGLFSFMFLFIFLFQMFPSMFLIPLMDLRMLVHL